MLNHTPENQRLVNLLARVALRDQQAFKELYDLTSSHLYGVSLRYLRTAATAEEILQEAYINVWQQAGTYAATLSSPMTWLISVVRNKALDHLRKFKRETESTDSVDAGAEGQVEAIAEHADPHELFSAATEAMVLKRCVALLDAPQRQSLALAFYDGLSHSELAEHLRVPLGTAKAWVRRGLERLRKCIEAQQQPATGRAS
ncbi:sigma-70 family RNA polymerase sigma factor [Massilia sp. CFBP9012]|uniref:sigma-70 family RNA polymerase sigma factor n=1 Tax=Massilia sp. CFBP9012 TaxID=3096531 RepID=UPI002A6A7795|nr:sigma-70 family RNA polymerase sigma factor [Massilia sp. CFBP9012]MDY0974761.1 sigma-70 family RNA polymerase sigma factor [Massilia sp. CFBP9012]